MGPRAHTIDVQRDSSFDVAITHVQCSRENHTNVMWEFSTALLTLEKLSGTKAMAKGLYVLNGKQLCAIFKYMIYLHCVPARCIQKKPQGTGNQTGWLRWKTAIAVLFLPPMHTKPRSPCEYISSMWIVSCVEA